ncbi:MULTISPECIES: hypothetical protein [unclassified Pseudomonas]|uniref:hypothetical protein n=1 Tax=unclassified Pseudomonas TaxID=196821 RepID=UPI0011AF6F00|nr:MULTISPECIES: hypothetical protein [unclassified Pseudomonas]
MEWDDFIGDIESLAEELYKIPETERTASALYGFTHYFRISWENHRTISTEGNGILIPPPRKKALFPRLSSAEEAEINFLFTLGEDFKNTSIPKRSDFQVKVDGFLDLGHSIVQLQDHWRVDSHDFDGANHENNVDADKIDEPDSSDPIEPHPYIHFQRGGHAQDSYASHAHFIPGDALPAKQDDCWVGLMQAPGPRIPFLPHCPILAIDYVIGQHDGLVWSRLRSLPGYRLIIQKSQARLWTPFFEALNRQDIRERWIGPVFI